MSRASKQLLMTLMCAANSITSGCVILPVPVPSETHIEYMDRETADFLKAGRSSRDEVLDELGGPTALSDGGSVWIYSVRKYLSGSWRICGAAMDLSGGGGAGCPTEFAREVKHSFLEIQFDNSKTVAHWQMVSLADGECTKAGFCWSEVPWFRTTSGDRVSTVNYCAVHLYTTEPAISAGLKIDGSGAFGLSMTNDDFQLVLLQRWQKRIVISFEDKLPRDLPVPCTTKSAYFARIDRGANSYDIKMVPEHVGRRAVISKQKMMPVNF